jgi:LmbE family N-acetylglucosaminyl deacetylase
MNKKILAIFAHPDDESFGPGGTLAKHAKAGYEIHILCATRGEAGRTKTGVDAGDVRAEELLRAGKVLGIKKVEFLDFRDGELSNNKYHKLAEAILEKIKKFKPEIILTFENLGVSGHLDHITVSLATTYAFRKQKIARKLYYYCIPRWRARVFNKYFIFFPPGYKEEEITTTIDITDVWEVKIEAMKQHKSQLVDVRKILRKSERLPKLEHFIRFDEEHSLTGLRETDFFDP